MICNIQSPKKDLDEEKLSILSENIYFIIDAIPYVAYIGGAAGKPYQH